MSTALITICDERDTEYMLEIDFQWRDAEPDIGLPSDWPEIEGIKCIQITHYCGSQHRDIDIPEAAQVLYGDWCNEHFADKITRAMEQIENEIDYPDDYEPISFRD